MHVGAKTLRCLSAIVPLVALPAAVFAQEATLSGTVTDSTGGVLPGVTDHRRARIVGQHLRRRHRRARRVPLAGSNRRIPRDGGAPGLRHGGAHREPARGPDRRGEHPDAAVGGAGIDHRHGRGAARRRGDLDARRQHRPPPDAGAADQRPQLDGPVDSGAGQPAERAEQHPAVAAGLRADQYRRPADHAPHSRNGSEPAELRHGRHCGVRARDEPVRRHAGRRPA